MPTFFTNNSRNSRNEMRKNNFTNIIVLLRWHHQISYGTSMESISDKCFTNYGTKPIVLILKVVLVPNEEERVITL